MPRVEVFVYCSVLVLGACAGGKDNQHQQNDAGFADSNDDTLLVFSVEAKHRRLVVDPYGIAPLSALLVISDPRIVPSKVKELQIDYRHPEHGFTEVLDYQDEFFARNYLDPDLVAGTEVGVPILGLFPDANNLLEISVVTSSGEYRSEVEVRTASIDFSLPSISVEEKKEHKMEPGWNMASFYSHVGEHLARPFIYDNDGYIRWVLLLERAVGPGLITPIERLKNGNWILGISNVIYEYSMLGREVEHWILPSKYSQHHDIFEMPSGNLLVAVSNGEAQILDDGEMISALSDHVLEIKRDNGKIINVWNLAAFLDVDRDDLTGADNGSDWLHLNSIIYAEADDSIIISAKHQGLAKITRGGEAGEEPNKNKQLRWILAPHVGWNRSGANGAGFELSSYLLVAEDQQGVVYSNDIQQAVYSLPQFEWVFGQHAPLLLPNGNLFVFDNGIHRDMGDFLFIGYSRGVEYRIEENLNGVGGSVQQVWQYGLERGQELYAPVISDVDLGGSTGNRFILPGSYTQKPNGDVGEVARMVEVTYPTKEVVFEAHIRMQGAHPWQSDICYRQERLPLYP